MEKNFRPAYLEVNVDQVIENAKLIKKHIGKNVKYCAVAKGNMYGLGIKGLVKYIGEYAYMFAVACLSEAIELRKLGVDKNILILGYTPTYQYEDIIKYDIIPTIYSIDDAKILDNIAREAGKIQNIHIKLDTGMIRLGYAPSEESKLEIIEISKLENLKIDGIFSHFTSAEEIDETITRNQYKIFKEFTDDLSSRGVELGIKHIANSSGTSDFKEFHEDMVRLGYNLSGLWDETANREAIPVKPVAQMKAKIVRIREVPEGTPVGYNHSYITNRTTKVATLPIGYSDGLPRGIREGYVSINGKKAKVLGSLCMDQMMVDVTDIDCKVLDEAIVYGYEDEAMAINELSKLCSTNNIDILSNTSRRVPRVYIKDGEIIDVVDEVLELYGLSV